MASGQHLAVGFVDLCGFSRAASELDDDGLGALLDRFDDICAGAVAATGARLVKTLGDGVLIASPAVEAVVGAVMHVVEGAERDDAVPAARGGVSGGRVLVRRGDYFGSALNRAARLTDVAPCGTVLVDWPVATVPMAGAASGVVVVDLDGFGSVTALRLDAPPVGALASSW